MNTILKTTTGLALTGAACVAYGTFVESKWFALRRWRMPVLPAGAEPISILHISDLHLLTSQTAKRRWVRGLADLNPDLVVNTGDNHSSPEAWVAVIDSFGPLLDRPGVFVWGSNDYYAPHLKNPFTYFAGPSKLKDSRPELPWQKLQESFSASGWTELTDARSTIEIKGQRLDFRGTDDAHLGRDRYELVAGPTDPDAAITIGVTHAPYLRVLDAMTADGCDVIFAGHTHGGQVCVPGYGALVTNCDLDTKRVKGLSQHTAGGNTAALEVSAGLGMSPFAPFRFACRPEASLITLTPRS